MTQKQELLNFVDGQWQRSRAGDALDVLNPATGAAIATVGLSPAAEVDAAVRAGLDAYAEWRETPVVDRVQPLFRLKMLLEEHIDDIGRVLTTECGKTFAESVGELRRGIENVEVACGTPSLIQGWNNEDIASGIDEHMIRQPLGWWRQSRPSIFPA